MPWITRVKQASPTRARTKVVTCGPRAKCLQGVDPLFSPSSRWTMTPWGAPFCGSRTKRGGSQCGAWTQVKRHVVGPASPGSLAKQGTEQQSISDRQVKACGGGVCLVQEGERERGREGEKGNSAPSASLDSIIRRRRHDIRRADAWLGTGYARRQAGRQASKPCPCCSSGREFLGNVTSNPWGTAETTLSAYAAVK